MFIARILMYSAPLGAACKLNAPKHMALRWSAPVLVLYGYKLGAPLEHFAVKIHVKTTFRAKPHKGTTCFLCLCGSKGS
jgi:hypothetical protein